MKRDKAIDVLKGIGILLVVYGHCVGGKICFAKYILSFHMGLFFFAAGYLLNGKTDIPFFAFLKKKAKAFAIPYTVFFVFSLLMAYLKTGALSGFTVGNVLWVYFINPSSQILGMKWLLPLWFLHHIFFAELLFWFVARSGKYVMGAIALCCLLFVTPYQKLFPTLPNPFTATALLSSIFISVRPDLT